VTPSADSNTTGLCLPLSLSQGGVCLATFPQWPRLVGLLYEPGIRVSQRIQAETGAVLALGASAPMAPGHLDPGKPRLYGCIGRRKPAKTGSPDAVSTGNSLCSTKNQRQRETDWLMSRCPRHYPLRLLVTWVFNSSRRKYFGAGQGAGAHLRRSAHSF